MKLFHVIRTTDTEDFRLVGVVWAETETEAFAKGVEEKLITRRGSFLVVLDIADPKYRTHRVQADGTVRFLEMPLAAAG